MVQQRTEPGRTAVLDQPRFVPRKRVALDDRVWWCVYDLRERQWSRYFCHGKYRTKRDAQWAIDLYNKRWFQ